MHEPRIVVADADRTSVSLVHAGLAGSGVHVIEAFDGETAMHIVRREQPSLAVLDVHLPGRSGLEIVRLVRADRALRALPIILMSARDGATDRILGLELGADDFIAKPFNPREVAARVKALLRRRALDLELRPNTVLEVGGLTIDADRHELMVDGRPIQLTLTEFRLLFVLMGQPGRAHMRSELIERALGRDFKGNDRTLDSHMRNLRGKIEHNPRRPRFIQTVFGVGYRLIAPAASAPARDGPSVAQGDPSGH